MITNIPYSNFEISLFKDRDYDPDSTDNSKNYDHFYGDKVNKDDAYLTKYGIELSKYGAIHYSALIVSSGGATDFSDTSFLIDEDALLICCGKSVFCLSLPELTLLWRVQGDPATCFEILKFKNNYIIHGELEISSLDRNGKLNWTFAGSDIFTTPTGKDGFKIKENIVFATNWDHITFQLDAYTGKEIDITSADQEKRYEILDGLPVYGEMYIPVSNDEICNYSEGLVVKFYKSDGTTWIANFSRGSTNLCKVYDFPELKRTVVFAFGQCYIMTDGYEKPLQTIGHSFSAVFEASDNILIAADILNFTVIEINKDIVWNSEMISYDGFRELGFAAENVTGLARELTTEEWKPFSFNYRTNKVLGTYNHDRKIKPWWQFW